MISYRKADLIDKIGPRTLVLGIDTDHVVRMTTSQHSGLTLGYTVPVCFRPLSDLPDKDMDTIDTMLMDYWIGNPYPLGVVAKDGDEWYAVKEDELKPQILTMMNMIVKSQLKDLGFNILSSKEMPYALALWFSLEPMVKTADLKDKIKEKIGYVGMPIRLMFSRKPGNTGIITGQDSEKIHFEVPGMSQPDWRYIASADITILSGRVYFTPTYDKNKYRGYNLIIDNKSVGKITDIDKAFIYTDKDKKIDPYNWGFTIDDPSRSMRLSK